MSTKITELTALAAPATTDVLPLVDLSGPTTKKATILAILGSGASTVGNGRYATGSGTGAYSALNLAGGAGWVTGVLPKANQGSQDMAGDVTGSTADSAIHSGSSGKLRITSIARWIRLSTQPP